MSPYPASCHSLLVFVLLLGAVQLFAILSQEYGSNARELLCRNVEVHQKATEISTLTTSQSSSSGSQDSFEDGGLQTDSQDEVEEAEAEAESPIIHDSEAFSFPASDSSTPVDFEGVQARAFTPYQYVAPCFEPGDDWMHHQSDPSQTGFLFVKPYKCGSSTASGLNLRIARNVAARQLKDFDICKARSDHVWANSKYANRVPDKSFMWTVVRNPTARIVSQFFHFRVSRAKAEPTDRNFIDYVTRSGPMDMIHDYYLNALSLHPYRRGASDPVEFANHILDEYNFIGITERMDESAVALAMLLNVPIGDLLYLTAKGHGGYDDAGGREDKVCTFIWPSFVSSGMQKYLDSEDWENKSHWDTVLYQAANRSLDLTIDGLGRERFYRNVALYEQAKKLSEERCLHHVTFPCSEGGEYTPSEETSCLWMDSGTYLRRLLDDVVPAFRSHTKNCVHHKRVGCGCECLDTVAEELGIDTITW